MANVTDIKHIKINKLKPYKNNAKIHTEAQLQSLAKSIKEFGFLSPCLVDNELNLIAGHGRIEAAKLAGLQDVPCVFVEGLTEEQKKAYILADNKLAELSIWDEALVAEELSSVSSFDMSDFGFDIPDIEDLEPEPDSYYGDERERTYDTYRLRQYDDSRVDGFYQIPILEPINFTPTELLGFNYVLSTKGDKVDKTVHFFIDDYQFERIWNAPEFYIEKLKKFEAVLTPDYSLYLDMPMAMKIWNVYRARLIGQICQDYGLFVIPTLTWAEPETFDFCFAGIPQNSTVAVSTVGVMNDEFSKNMWRTGMDEAIIRLKPKKIICYGSKIDYDFGDIEVIYFQARQFVKNGSE